MKPHPGYFNGLSRDPFAGDRNSLIRHPFPLLSVGRLLQMASSVYYAMWFRADRFSWTPVSGCAVPEQLFRGPRHSFLSFVSSRVVLPEGVSPSREGGSRCSKVRVNEDERVWRMRAVLFREITTSGYAMD